MTDCYWSEASPHSLTITRDTHLKGTERRAQVRPSVPFWNNRRPWPEPQVKLSLLRSVFFKLDYRFARDMAVIKLAKHSEQGGGRL